PECVGVLLVELGVTDRCGWVARPETIGSEYDQNLKRYLKREQSATPQRRGGILEWVRTQKRETRRLHRPVVLASSNRAPLRADSRSRHGIDDSKITLAQNYLSPNCVRLHHRAHVRARGARWGISLTFRQSSPRRGRWRGMPPAAAFLRR